MKKLWILLALASLLCGCTSEETLETISDDIIQPVMAQPGEISVRLPDNAVAPVLEHMANNGVLGGFDLSVDYPELGNALLVCTTETKTAADITRYVAVLEKALREA